MRTGRHGRVGRSSLPWAGAAPRPAVRPDHVPVGRSRSRPDTGAPAAEIADSGRRADRADTGVLILGGGSNLVVADAGIDTPIIRIGSPRHPDRPAR